LGEREREKRFLFFMQEMGRKTPNGVPCHLILYSKAGVIYVVVKDNGSEWLRWLLEQGRVVLSHPIHRDNRCALDLPFGDYSPHFLW
jgi:hypothetical protein